MIAEVTRLSKLETRDKDQFLQTTRRLLVDVQALSSRIAAVQEIALAINQHLDITGIFKVIGQQAKWIINFNTCSVTLTEGDEIRTVVLRVIPTNAEPLFPADDVIAKSLKSRQAQLLDVNGVSHIILPLHTNGCILGTIQFSLADDAPYTVDDLRIGNLLAVQLANAIHNANQFAEITQLYRDLKRAEGMRDNLIHMLVHDLRNPLGNMLNNLTMIELLAERGNHATLSRYINRSEESGKRILNMLEDLLLVGKMESGNFNLLMEEGNLLELVGKLWPEYKDQASQKQINLTAQLMQHPPIINADWELLARVFDNLVGNAFKYTKRKGNVCLMIDVDDEEVIVAVEDNGVGISAENKQTIFDKFSQVNNKTRSGVGLGLTFCKMIVDAHGGRIWVDDTVGGGSTFCIALPIG